MRKEYNEYVCFSRYMSQNGYFGSWFFLTVKKYDCQHVLEHFSIARQIVDPNYFKKSFLYPKGSFLAELTFLVFIENYGEKHLRINSKSSRLASGAHFPSVLMIFKTAISFKVFILGISVFSKTCWKLNFTAIQVIFRVPCTAVFLRSRTSGFQYWIF